MKKTTYIYYLCKDNEIPFYIGKTQNPIKIRLSNHIYNKNLKDLKINIIDEIPTNEWKFWEKYYISLFKSWGFVLENKNNGGNGPTGGYSLSQITKNKIGISNSKPKPKGFGDKLSKIRIGIPLPLGTGVKISKNKIGHSCYNDSQRGEKISKSKNKPVIQYSIDGKYIKEWESGKQASKYIQIDSRGISLCCRGKGKTAGGFVWKFKI